MIPGNGEADQVKIEFQARNGFDLEGLRVISFEKNYFGLAGGIEHPIKNGSCNISLSGRAEKFGMYIDIFTGDATKEIHRPKMGKKPAKTDYVDVYERTAVVKDKSTQEDEVDTIGERLEKVEILRKSADFSFRKVFVCLQPVKAFSCPLVCTLGQIPYHPLGKGIAHILLQESNRIGICLEDGTVSGLQPRCTVRHDLLV